MAATLSALKLFSLSSLLEATDASWRTAELHTQGEDEKDMQLKSRTRKKVFESVLGLQCLQKTRGRKLLQLVNCEALSPAARMVSLPFLEAAHHRGVAATLLQDTQNTDELTR